MSLQNTVALRASTVAPVTCTDITDLSIDTMVLVASGDASVHCTDQGVFRETCAC